ncbi:MAG TPA: glutathione S-transferase [Rhizomicrobium sp.]|jgi:glutathione S-transferase|nr:glutathione S-transferase [Rhizomicrobium sp.]
MRLIGMLDSPYVRRVAVSLKLMQLPFELEQLSVFRNYGEFAAINAVVKAPTLVTDDGTVLMDSTLILDHAERLADPALSLMPREDRARDGALGIIGLALAANEKTVQIVYERNLRPPERQHQPWLDRVHGQLQQAYIALEREIAQRPAWFGGSRMMQPDVTVAVAWRFARSVIPQMVAEAEYPYLAAHSLRAESLPAFVETGF